MEEEHDISDFDEDGEIMLDIYGDDEAEEEDNNDNSDNQIDDEDDEGGEEEDEDVDQLTEAQVKARQLSRIRNFTGGEDDPEFPIEKNTFHNYAHIPTTSHYREIVKDAIDRKKEKRLGEKACPICRLEENQVSQNIATSVGSILAMWDTQRIFTTKKELLKNMKSRFNGQIRKELSRANIPFDEIKIRDLRRHFTRNAGGCGNRSISTLTTYQDSLKDIAEFVRANSIRMVNPTTRKEVANLKGIAAFRGLTKDIIDIQKILDKKTEEAIASMVSFPKGGDPNKNSKPGNKPAIKEKHIHSSIMVTSASIQKKKGTDWYRERK